MDSASKLILKQNKKLIQSLDIYHLKPFLKDSQIFTNSMLADIYSSESELDLSSELPTRGPQAFSKFLEVLEKAGLMLEANQLKSTPKYVEGSKVKSVFYSMKSEPLGYCVIINNVEFDYLSKREGSDVDAEELKLLFEKMRFNVEVKDNLTGKAMKMFLKSFAKSKKLKTVDCCFVIILSHGDKNNVIYGTDSFEVQKDEIHDIFNNVNCENLRNKPKIFLYQACRGSSEDHGVESADSTNELNSETDKRTVDVADAIPYETNSSVIKKNPSMICIKKDPSMTCIKKDPSMNDMLIMHSSLPDHKAYRNHEYGSWLIQDIVSVFSLNYKKQDLENMFKSVSRKIQKRLFIKGQKKQVPHSENKGFRASLHLCSNDEYEGCDITLRDYLS